MKQTERMGVEREKKEKKKDPLLTSEGRAVSSGHLQPITIKIKFKENNSRTQSWEEKDSEWRKRLVRG
jgi:hypothetical protein